MALRPIEMPKESHLISNGTRLPGKFSILLGAIVASFALRPFLEGLVKINILTDFFFFAVLLSAINAVSERRRDFVMALMLAVPYLLLKWSTYIVTVPLIEDLSRIIAALFTAYVLIFILSYIIRQQEITADVIMAAVCGYFFMGLMWAFILFFLESVSPGSFLLAQAQAGDFWQFVYFSFVTMTTLGYGDVTPLSNAACSLAVLEAAMGQLYLAVTIARLVGIHITQATK
jgi:hypothetical protein